MRYSATKKFDLGSAAFRQWRAKSHCRFIHGYRLTADVTFTTKKLDERNWVVDYGGFDVLKLRLQALFDHNLIIADDDPKLKLLQDLHLADVARIRVCAKVGTEAFAELVYGVVSSWLATHEDQHVRHNVTVEKVTVREHETNSATVQEA